MRSIDDFIEEAHGSNTARNRSRYWIMLLSMGLANMGDATELGCMGFLLTDSDFEQSILRGDISKYGAMFTGSIFAGMLFGGIFTGAFGDQQGRRPTLLLGLTLNSIAGFSAALASNVFIMCLCRFLSGLGIGAILASLIPLATELSPTSKRGAYITLINGFLPIGGLMVGGLAMFMLTKWEMSWRLFVGACSVPSFLGLMLVYLFVPESPRYLALAGRFEEAAKQANSVARAMGFDGTMLQTTELEHHYLHSNEGNDNRGYRKTFSEALEEATNGLKDLYSPSLRTSTISLQVLWFCIGSGSGFGTWLLPIFEEVHINRVYLTLFLYWLANVPGLFTAAVFIDKLGRKKVLITSLICAGICMLFFAGAVHVGAEDSDLGVTVTSFMYHIYFSNLCHFADYYLTR